MNSLPHGFKAIVFGATGAIGSAFVHALENTPGCGQVIGLSRQSQPRIDLQQEVSIANAARALAPLAPFHLLIDATGVLHIDGTGPEKRLDDIDADTLLKAFSVNAVGPALLLKHFTPLLPGQARCIFASLSARVGSIGDNRKGGWYGYRASKAALNMLLQTAAIEIARKRPEAVVAALQPGTVRSRLSAPFLSGGETTAIAPERSAAMLLGAIDDLAPTRRAAFIDYNGEPVPW